MSQINELLACYDEESFAYILQNCRKNLSYSLHHLLVKFYYDMSEYTLSASNKKLEYLSATFMFLSTSLHELETDISNFEHLINAILNQKDERHIIELSISALGNEDNGILPLLRPKRRSFFSKDESDFEHYNNRSQNLESLMTGNLRNVFCETANFWDVFFENKGWSKQTSRIWESYQKYEDAEKKQRLAEPQELEMLEEIDHVENPHKDKSGMIFGVHENKKEAWDWLIFFNQNFLEQMKGPSPKPSEKYPIVIEKPYFQIHGQYCRTKHIRRVSNPTKAIKLDFLVKSIDLPQDGPTDWENINVLGEFSKLPCKYTRQNKFLQLSRSVREVFCAQPLRRYIHGFCLFREEFELWLFDRSGAYSSGPKKIVDNKEMLIRALSSYLLMNNEELGRDMTILQRGEDRLVQFHKIGDTPGPSFEIKPYVMVHTSRLVSSGTTCYETKDESTVIKYSWSRPKENTEAYFLNSAKDVRGVVNCITSEVVYETKSHLKNVCIFPALRQDIRAGENFNSESNDAKEPLIPSVDKNLQLTRIALTPCGRSVYSSGCIHDFVAGIRDAIKAHEELAGKGILHGDISDGNIILLKPSPASDLYGMLIDLDHSVKMEGGKTLDDDSYLIGTMKFMAQERMMPACTGIKTETIGRTCRHDLESFFYVFIVGCIECECVFPEKGDNLDRWSSDDFRSSYSTKVCDLLFFDNRTLNKFTTSFKGLKDLARKWRQILFNEDGRYIETPIDCGPLYRNIINALDETINDIKGGKIENKVFCAR